MALPSSSPAQTKPSDTLLSWAQQAGNVVDPGAAKPFGWGVNPGTPIPPASWANFLQVVEGRWNSRSSAMGFVRELTPTVKIVTFTNNNAGSVTVPAGTAIVCSDANNPNAIFLTRDAITVGGGGAQLTALVYAQHPGPVHAAATTVTTLQNPIGGVVVTDPGTPYSLVIAELTITGTNVTVPKDFQLNSTGAGTPQCYALFAGGPYAPGVYRLLFYSVFSSIPAGTLTTIPVPLTGLASATNPTSSSVYGRNIVYSDELTNGAQDNGVDQGGAGGFAADGASWVFGSDDMDSRVTTATPTRGVARIFFDKVTSSFRAGYFAGTQADSANRGLYSVAIGYNCQALSIGSVALGYNNSASNSESVTIGFANSASGSHSVAIGDTCTASGASSFAAGNGCVASASGAVAVGSFAVAGAAGAFAAGASTVANGAQSVAIGDGSVASGQGAFAVGHLSAAAGQRSVAIGTSNNANGAFDVALGYTNTVDGNPSAANGGNGAWGNLNHVGNHGAAPDTNLCWAIGDTNLIGQLSAALDCVAIGHSNTTDGNDLYAFGRGNLLGGAIQGQNHDCTAIGRINQVGHAGFATIDSHAFGRANIVGSVSGGTDCIAIGNSNTVDGTSNWVVGTSNIVAGSWASVFGSNHTTTTGKNYQGAFGGYGCLINSNYGSSIGGYQCEVHGDYATATGIGADARITAAFTQGAGGQGGVGSRGFNQVNYVAAMATTTDALSSILRPSGLALIIKSSASYVVRVVVSGLCVAAGGGVGPQANGDTCFREYVCLIRVAANGVQTKVGETFISNTIHDASLSPAALALDVSTANELRVTISVPGTTGQSRWTAAMTIVETVHT